MVSATQKTIKKKIKVKKTVIPDSLRPFLFQPGVVQNAKGRGKGSKDGVRVILRRALNSGAFPEALEGLRQRGINLKDGSHNEALVAILLHMATVGHNTPGDLAAIQTIIKETERPLAREVDPEDPDPDTDIKVTVKIIRNGDV